MYGPRTLDRARLEADLSEIPWAKVWNELSPQRLASLVASSSALLRPTDRDGDSLIIREAIALGTRVIASDVSPRPAGVEVAERTPTALYRALSEGGSKSTGAGLGDPVDLALLELLQGDRNR